MRYRTDATGTGTSRWPTSTLTDYVQRMIRERNVLSFLLGIKWKSDERVLREKTLVIILTTKLVANLNWVTKIPYYIPHIFFRSSGLFSKEYHFLIRGDVSRKCIYNIQRSIYKWYLIAVLNNIIHWREIIESNFSTLHLTKYHILWNSMEHKKSCLIIN